MIEQAQAERMRDALIEIVYGLAPHIEDPGIPPGLSPDDVVGIAGRALNPDEWERVHD